MLDETKDAVVQAIQDGVETKIIEVGGEKFATRQVYRVPKIPMPGVLEIATLQGVVDYLANDIDAHEVEAGIFIHIASHDEVRLVKYLDGLNDRAVFLAAKYPGHKFQFSFNYEQADFITMLQSQFVETDARKAVQSIVGKLSEESSLHLVDDGLSQKTTAKTGVTTSERVDLPNPLMLQPFRTFAEIDQPESPFILRLHKREDRIPLISLHEADNEKWKVQAIENIKAFLSDKVKVPVIA